MSEPLALPPPRFTIINQWDHWQLSREQLVDRETELRNARLYEFRIPRANRIPGLYDELTEQSARLAEAAMQLLCCDVAKARAYRKGRKLFRQAVKAERRNAA